MAHVLIVHEDDDIREALCLVLTDEEHTVLAAARADFGLALLGALPVGAVVLCSAGAPVPRDRPNASSHGMLLVRATEVGSMDLVDRYHWALLTTHPGRLSPQVEGLILRHRVAVIAEPFDIGDLVACVARLATDPDANTAVSVRSAPATIERGHLRAKAGRADNSVGA